MTNDDVLNKRYPPEADDKVFLTCVTKRTEHGFDIHIDSTLPAVWLDDRYRDRHGHADDLVIHDRSDGMGFAKTHDTHGLHLLSAGVLLWSKDDLVLLKRDEGAPSYPGALTEAAGRCGELPATTMLKELNEEILIAADDNGERMIVGLAGPAFDERNVRALREKQIAMKGETGHINIIDVSVYQPEQLDTGIARVFLDGRQVDQIEGPHFFDDGNLTMEIRQSYRLPDNLNLLSIQDGEPYNREVLVVNPASLSAKETLLVPSLEHLVTRLHEKELEQNATVEMEQSEV